MISQKNLKHQRCDAGTHYNDHYEYDDEVIIMIMMMIITILILMMIIMIFTTAAMVAFFLFAVLVPSLAIDLACDEYDRH